MLVPYVADAAAASLAHLDLGEGLAGARYTTVPLTVTLEPFKTAVETIVLLLLRVSSGCSRVGAVEKIKLKM